MYSQYRAALRHDIDTGIVESIECRMNMAELPQNVYNTYFHSRVQRVARLKKRSTRPTASKDMTVGFTLLFVLNMRIQQHFSLDFLRIVARVHMHAWICMEMVYLFILC